MWHDTNQEGMWMDVSIEMFHDFCQQVCIQTYCRQLRDHLTINNCDKIFRKTILKVFDDVSAFG